MKATLFTNHSRNAAARQRYELVNALSLSADAFRHPIMIGGCQFYTVLVCMHNATLVSKHGLLLLLHTYIHLQMNAYFLLYRNDHSSFIMEASFRLGRIVSCIEDSRSLL